MLAQSASGFGALALAALLGDKAYGAVPSTNPLAPRLSHFAPKAKSVIFLYMDGGVSQVDSFDPKPRLRAEHGKPFAMKMEPTQFDDNGSTFGNPWDFHQYGQSGAWVSDLFPHVAQCVDDLCIVRSMVSNFSEHNAANYFLHTGHGLQGRPSMGAWASYGLGSENQDLPGFVVLNGGLIPSGGADNFGSGFLPAAYQRTSSGSSGRAAARQPAADGRTRCPRHAAHGRGRPARGCHLQLRTRLPNAVRRA
jgi:hypothetical protein